MMKLKDVVVIKYPNPLYSERYHEWQAWEVLEIRKQATGIVTRLKGLCIGGSEVIGYSPEELEIIGR